MSKHGKTQAHNHVQNRHNKPKVKYSEFDKVDMYFKIGLVMAFLTGIALIVFK